MAKLCITEFSGLQVASGVAHSAESAQAAMLPGATQVITFGGTSVASTAFSSATKLVRVHTDAACHITAGDSPTATAGDMRLGAGQTEYFGVVPGQKLAALAGV